MAKGYGLTPVLIPGRTTDSGIPQSAGPLFEKLVIIESEIPDMRPPGRPRTRTEAHYAALLQVHADLTRWFSGRFGRVAKSDAELLRAYVEAGFRQAGMRESRATSPAMRRKLKTLRNELSTARRLIRTNPENPLFTGLFGLHSDDVQTSALTSKEGFYVR